MVLDYASPVHIITHSAKPSMIQSSQMSRIAADDLAADLDAICEGEKRVQLRASCFETEPIARPFLTANTPR